MNLAELQQKLDRHEISRDWYSLTGGLPPEAWCLEQQGGLWFFYYSERGQRSGEKSFDDEASACEYFWAQVQFQLDH